MFERHNIQEPLVSIHESSESYDSLVAISATFRHMEYRKLRRKYGGTYKKKNFILVIWVMAFFLWLFGCITITTTQTFRVSFSWDRSILGSLLTIILAYAATRLSLWLRWCLYWLFIGAMLMLFVGPETAPSWDTLTESVAYRAIAIVILVLEVITICIFVFTHFVWPRVVRSSYLDTIRSWQLARAQDDPHTYIYKRPLHWFSRAHHFTYRGEVNAKGQPHGFGEWIDDHYHGECLRGTWANGLPVGPFKSREYGSGYAFSNVRVAFVTNRGDDWKANAFYPTYSPDGLKFGVASVESSVSGSWFRDFPQVDMISEPEACIRREQAHTESCSCVKWCVSQLKHSQENEPITQLTITADRHGGLVISGFEPIRESDRTNVTIMYRGDETCIDHESIRGGDSTPLAAEGSHMLGTMSSFLEVRGWRATRETAFEALVFIPGYNCSLEYAIKRFGQLLSLGEFPAHIKPFVFSWPAGDLTMYFKAIQQGVESDQTAKDFTDFIARLKNSGCRHVHILAHSLAARLVMKSLPLLEEVVEPVRLSDQYSFVSDNPFAPIAPRKIYLSTVTLLNPDYPVNRFMKDDYSRLSRLCSHITIYADKNDIALAWVDLITWDFRMGRCTKPLFQCDVGQEEISKKKDRTLWRERRCIDVDIIDTTWMEDNVHTVRHNFFNINRLMVDDLRDVIDLKRASNRSRLVQREGNVYNFLFTPAHIKNK